MLGPRRTFTEAASSSEAGATTMLSLDEEMLGLGDFYLGTQGSQGSVNTLNKAETAAVSGLTR